MSGLPVEAGDRGVPSADLVAAALRADAQEVDTLVRVLAASLGETLPPGMVEVDRHRSVADRLAGRPGSPVSVTITGSEVRLRLAPAARRGGPPDTEIHRVVRGVTISRAQVGLDEWIDSLAVLITEQARLSAEARTALSRLLDT